MTFKVSESILGLKKANNLGKIGVINGFQSNMENESILGLKKAKNLGKIGVSNGFQIWKTMVFKVSESTLGLKEALNLGNLRGSHDF